MQQPRSQLQTAQQCVFNDVLQLDFTKYKQAVDEHAEGLRFQRERFEEEHKADNDKWEVKVEERVKKLTGFLRIMARAAEYARNARAWL